MTDAEMIKQLKMDGYGDAAKRLEELRPVKEVPDYMRMVYIDEFTGAVRWDIDVADQCGCSEEYIKGKQSALDAIDDINYYEARSIKCPKCLKQFMTIDNDIGKFIYCPCCGEAVKWQKKRS